MQADYFTGRPLRDQAALKEISEEAVISVSSRLAIYAVGKEPSCSRLDSIPSPSATPARRSASSGVICLTIDVAEEVPRALVLLVENLLR